MAARRRQHQRLDRRARAFVNRGYVYTGEFLAERHDVVVVSLNYRLGVFGFVAHPELAAKAVR